MYKKTYIVLVLLKGLSFRKKISDEIYSASVLFGPPTSTTTINFLRQMSGVYTSCFATVDLIGQIIREGNLKVPQVTTEIFQSDFTNYLKR